MRATVFALLTAAACLAQDPEALIEAGRYGDAAAHYEAALKRKPGSPDALLALGVCYSQLGRRADAVAVLKRHVTLAPRSAMGHSVLGLLWIEMGELGQAQAALETALKLNPGEAETAKGLARVHWLQGRPARTAALLRPLAKADQEARFLLAEALLETGKAAEAAGLVRASARPGAPESTYVLACRAELAAGPPEAAMGLCEAGLREYPDSDRLTALYLSLPPDLLNRRLRARAAANGTDVRELAALARTLMDADPERKTAALDTAAGLLDRARTLAPRDPVVQYQYGRLLRILGRPEAEVFAEYDKALKLGAPGSLRIRIWLEIGHREKIRAQTEAAERAFSMAVEANRKASSPRPEAPFAYFQFLRETSRPAEAERMLEEALRFEPLYAPARLERGKAAANLERWLEAVREAELALANAGGDAVVLRAAHALLVRAYSALGRVDQAQVHQAWVEAH